MNRLLIGATDKTPLAFDFMRHDFAEGFLLIDTTGKTAPRIANAIPKSYIERTFYFEPDTMRSPAFNVLRGVSDDQKDTTAQLIRTIIDRLYPDGIQTLTRLRSNYLLTHALRFLSDQPNSTLLDVFETIKDMFPEWDKNEKDAAILDIDVRLGDLFASPAVRAIIDQPRSTFSLTNGKIVIANLDRSVVGDKPAKFLAYLFAAKAKGNVYIDDLAFLADDFLASLLPRGGFTLMAESLPSERRHPELREALLSMEPYVFRTSKRDAEELAFHVNALNPRTQITELAPTRYRTQSGEHEVPVVLTHRNLMAIRKRSRARNTRESRH